MLSSLLVLGSLAYAGPPCGGVEGASELVTQLGDAADAVKTKKKEKQIKPLAGEKTLKMLDQIQVHKMEYCAEFDCDDFALAFDAECGKAGIQCWEAKMHAWPWFFGARQGHVVNVVAVDPADGTNRTKYVLIEPQSNVVKLSWFQAKGTTPSFPDDKLEALGDKYDWFDLKYKRVTIFPGGHSTTAGEKPFFKIPRIRKKYQELTGHDPSSYTE